MAKVIRHVMSERLRLGRGWRELAADFKELTGLPLTLFGPMGEEWQGCRKCEASALCKWVQEQPRGVRMCNRTIQGLLEEAGDCAVERVCDAGLVEMAVPVATSGQVVGYLVTGSFRVAGDAGQQINRARHLLERAGIHAKPDPLELPHLMESVREITPGRLQAVRRWLEMSARALGESLKVREGADRYPAMEQRPALPHAIQQALVWLRAHFSEPVQQQDVAAQVGLSVAHFSHLFNRTTGLKFTEYLMQLRLQVACERLRATHRPIGQIAHESGFQSISQFNRCFQSGLGTTPRQWRRMRE